MRGLQRCKNRSIRYVYTAIAGKIDLLGSPGPLPPGWRAVCFSDGQTHPDWEMRALPELGLEPGPASRVPKVMAHHALPDAELSLWMDANISITCDLDELAAGYLDDREIAFHPHPARHCVYEEAVACIELNRDDPSAIVEQVVGYALGGYPRQAGLIAGGVILRRHTPSIEKFNTRWWQEMSRHTFRDQLSANFVLRELGIDHALFESSIRQGPLFKKREHDNDDRLSSLRQIVKGSAKPGR